MRGVTSMRAFQPLDPRRAITAGVLVVMAVLAAGGGIGEPSPRAALALTTVALAVASSFDTRIPAYGAMVLISAAAFALAAGWTKGAERVFEVGGVLLAIAALLAALPPPKDHRREKANRPHE